MLAPKALMIAGALAWAGIVAAMFTVSREPSPVMAAQPAFDERWEAAPDEILPLKKQDRLAVATPEAVAMKTEQAALTPPEAPVEAKPVPHKKKKLVETAEREVEHNDICRAHHLRKVWVTSRRWRCRR